jgi:hypothetical protein
VGIATLKDPGEHIGQRVYITIGQDRVAIFRPAITHQVGAFLKIGGMPKTESMTNFMKRNPLNHLRIIGGLTPGWWSFRADKYIRAAMLTTHGKPSKDSATGMGDVMHNDICGLLLASL